MTSRELERQKNAFKNQVDRVINNYRDAMSKVSNIDKTFQNSDDTILRSIVDNNNKEIIKSISDFISKAESLEASIISKTNEKIAELKKQEDEENDE